MKLRKVTSFLTAGVLFFASSVPIAKAYEETYAPRDINSHWAEDSLATMVNAGIIKGSQSYVNPDKSISRGEFSALTARTLALDLDTDSNFDDIPKGHMFYKEINALKGAGIISGVGNNIFASDRNITREEIMLIISRCTPNTSKAKVNFKDIKSDYKYIDELKTAVGSGIVSGYDDNTFRPYEKASRAECAVMLERLLKAFEDIEKDDALSLAEEFIENDTSNTQKNLNLSIGRANEETSLKLKAQSRIQKNDAQVTKLLNNADLKKCDINGSFASVSYEGDIQYVTVSKSASKLKTYKAVYDIDIINQNGTLYVYDCSLSLKKKDKINLTWEVYSSVPDYAPGGVNVISPSSFQISKENLGVEKRELLGDIKFYNSLTRKYVNYAKENGYELWPIYKTDFTLKTADEFLNSKETRMKAIEYLLDYAVSYQTDGINIDFENIYERNRYLVTKHVRELSVMLHELGLVVSADITRLEPTSSNWSMCYDRDALSENCDYIMLMAYDEYYASSKSAGPVASLDWTEESVKRTLKEVPKDKLVLGIPFYMRYFEVTGSKVTSTKAISMQTAYELIQKNNPAYTYMEEDGQYKISWKNGNKTCVFWLENTDTVAKRVELVNKYSLAGVASWRRGLEISKVWEVIENNL